MQQSYYDFAQYYDLFFQEKDYKKEIDFIKTIIKKKNINQDSLLDVGCGTGTHLDLLKKEFKILYGVDLSPQILNVAKDKVSECTFLEADMKDFQIDKTFNVILCLYSVFNYNLDLESAIRTLKNFNKHLEEEGIIIIALYNERHTEKQFSLHVGEDTDTKAAKLNEFKFYPEEKIEKSNRLLLVKSDNKVDFDIEVEDKFRIFDFDEIAEIVKKSGFDNYTLYDGFTFEEASEDKTRYPILVLKK